MLSVNTKKEGAHLLPHQERQILTLHQSWLVFATESKSIVETFVIFPINLHKYYYSNFEICLLITPVIYFYRTDMCVCLNRTVFKGKPNHLDI
jgi:hypothetical protein